jgi:hypothetical protein
MVWCLVKHKIHLYGTVLNEAQENEMSAMFSFFSYVRFEVFTLMKIQAISFCDVMLCTNVVAYHHFGGPCFLHLQVLHAENGGSMAL